MLIFCNNCLQSGFLWGKVVTIIGNSAWCIRGYRQKGMLTGNYFNTIDAKGRVFVPTKLRYELGERIWLVKGIDACLYIFTQEGWAAFTGEYVNNRTLKDAKARRLQRFVLGGSRELEIDRQGRVNLPQDHMDYAGIVRDVVFVGCADRIDGPGVWSGAPRRDRSPGQQAGRPR